MVKVVQQQRAKQCLYYLTEYIDGQSITSWSASKPHADVAGRLEKIEQLVKGCRAMHRKETLHQDLKPDNILVDGEGVVKIIDFGSCFVGGIAEIAAPNCSFM